MNKSAVLSIVGCLLAVPAVATDSRQAMLDMLVSQMHTSPELTRDASCLGVPVDTLKDAFERHLYQCAETQPAQAAANVEAFMDALENCYMPAVSRELGVSKRKFDACGVASDDNAQNGLDDDIQRAMGGVLSFARATQDQITLPIYKNSQIIVHMTEAEDGDQFLQIGNETVEVLPAATFASPDSPEKVLAFYKNKLPGFEVKQLARNEFILMEIMPPNFDLLNHVQAYTSTPHVLIKKAAQVAEGVMPADTQSMIEIAYRR